MEEDQSIIDVPIFITTRFCTSAWRTFTPRSRELERRGVTFTGGAPHMIYKHPDGLEEWLTFFQEPGGGVLSLISQVRS